MASLCSVACSGQTAAPEPSSPLTAPPVPHAVWYARKLFISNAGSDSGLFPHPFSGTPDRPYVEFYDAVQQLGRFQIVPDPAQADIVLEIRLNAPNGPQVPNKQNGAADPLPMLRLIIYDRPTHYILWALTESVETAALQKTHDKHLDEAVQLLADDFARLNPNATPPAH